MYSASLVNDPFGDPAVYMEFKYRQSSILFDLGDLRSLATRKILKVDYIFVSHTHMDHFIGFDHFLRICLGRERHVHLFGPSGFINHVEHKLQAYTWNLVENYENDFTLIVTEVHPDGKETRQYRCQAAFKPEFVEKTSGFDGILVEDRFFRVKGVFLDHRIPCMAFRFEETRRINVMKSALAEMGYPTGKWLMAFKEQIIRRDPDETPIRIWWQDASGDIIEKWMPLGQLRDRVIKITAGKQVAYVTDAIYDEKNARLIIALAEDADLLFIEATFLHADHDRASEKYHLTAAQAGELARKARAKRMILFHFSPKYRGCEDTLRDEAAAAFSNQAGERKIPS